MKSAQQIITELDEIASTYMRLVHSRNDRVKKLTEIMQSRDDVHKANIKNLEAEIKALKKPAEKVEQDDDDSLPF